MKRWIRLLALLSSRVREGKAIRLLTREVSLGKIHPGIIVESLVVSPDSKHFAYGAERGDKVFVVVDGEEGKGYDGFLRGSKLVFDSPNSFHGLARRGIEIFRVEVEIEATP